MLGRTNSSSVGTEFKWQEPHPTQLNIPESWAVDIIGEDEYKALLDVVKEAHST